MSTSILHRPKSDVDDQTGDSGFLANAVSSDANDTACQYCGLDDLCLAYQDDQPVDDAALDPLSRFYQQARDVVFDGWRLIPVQAVNRPDVQVIATTSNMEVSS